MLKNSGIAVFTRPWLEQPAGTVVAYRLKGVKGATEKALELELPDGQRSLVYTPTLFHASVMIGMDTGTLRQELFNWIAERTELQQIPILGMIQRYERRHGILALADLVAAKRYLKGFNPSDGLADILHDLNNYSQPHFVSRTKGFAQIVFSNA